VKQTSTYKRISIFEKKGFCSLRLKLTAFGIAFLALIVAFTSPLRGLVALGLQEGYSSHVLIAPAIAAYFFWTYREKIFSAVRSPGWAAIPFISAGGAAILLARDYSGALSNNDYLSLATLSFLLFIIGIFISIFGYEATVAATFPFALLIFLVPLPSLVVEAVISGLQFGSAALVHWIFLLLGVPVLRNGTVFTVPGVSIEIAKECSGINSTIALVITAILISHETLRSTTRRILFVMLVLPLSLVKNAIRIVSLTLLATHVDMSFLTGNLHHHGGVVFFLVTLVLMLPIWKAVKRSDTNSASCQQQSGELVLPL